MVFHGQIITPDKHKVSAPNAPLGPIQKWSKLFAPEKIEETWKKLTFKHTTITLGLVSK